MARIDTTLTQAAIELATSTTPRLDAELLLAYCLDKPRSYLFTWPEATIAPHQLHHFQQLLTERRQGKPIAYITGEQSFWSLRLNVCDSTLIPRPDTELLVELALSQALPEEQQAIVADLGTGSGAIALALAHERPNWHIRAIDSSPQALTVARANARLNSVTNVAFFEGSWCEPLGDVLLDMIVSNPPYIPSDDHHLQQGDLRFEPLSALASGSDGLNDIRLIARQSLPRLKNGGCLLLEHGFDQGGAVRDILRLAGFRNIHTEADLAGHDRVTMARKMSATP